MRKVRFVILRGLWRRTHIDRHLRWLPRQWLRGMTSAIVFFSIPTMAQARAEIRNGRFYVNNEPFYVRAVGYSSLRPHQRPDQSYAGVNHSFIDRDFERIKAAHFNTIRSFDALSNEELELAQAHGLMVIQGIWMDRRQDFSNTHNLGAAVAAVQRVAEESKGFDNVLGYLVMAKPQPGAVLDSGIGESIQHFRRLKRAIQTIDPRPVSLDSWLPLAFLDHSDSDFVTFTAFSFWPRSINDALSYAGYVRWLTDHFATDRPLLIGGTGGYSVSKATFTPEGGFGGLSEYNQSLKDLESLRGTIEGHASGSVLVSFLDSWSAGGDPDTHDDNPWEWNGIVGLPTDARSDMAGVPRQALKDVTAYNEIFLLEPRANHFYPPTISIPIEAATADNVLGVRYSVNGGDWLPLEGSGHGRWSGFFKLPKLARKRQKISIQALNAKQEEIAEKDISILAAMTPETVTIESLPEKAGEKGLSFVIHARDGQHKPLAQRKITYGCFLPVTLRDAGATAVTNAEGDVTVRCALTAQKEDRYLFLAAGTKSPERVISGDMRIFKLGR